MCGIVGYVGVKQAAPILLAGLSKLEYRGYDSAGLAVRDEASEHIEVVKAKGRLKNLMEMTDSGNAVHGLCGIGHTRWATHGEPSTVNAHPQYTREKRVVLVHNGIIENYQEIKESLLKKGYTFASQTDTEVAAALLDSYYADAAKRGMEPRERALDAIRNMMIRVRGSYALGILFGDQPGAIYAARKDSPLILGRCDGEYQGYMIASDVPAVLNYTRNVVYIDNQEIACLTRDELHVYNIDCEEIEKPFVEIKWDAAAAEKDGYEHFMMKEIHEQPRAMRDTLSPRIKENEDGEKIIDTLETTDEEEVDLSKISLQKEGYTLTGWSDGTNDYSLTEPHAFGENVTLTPKWSVNRYVVKIYDGETELFNESYDYGTSPEIAPLQKAGYRLEGYYKEADFSGEKVSLPQTVTGDLILYTKWIPEQTTSDGETSSDYVCRDGQ